MELVSIMIAEISLVFSYRCIIDSQIKQFDALSLGRKLGNAKENPSLPRKGL